MKVLALCAFAVLAVFLASTVKQLDSRFGALVVTAAGIIFWVYAVKELLPLIQTLIGITEENALGGAFASLFRALGLVLVVSFAASVCRDLGEESIAEKLEFCGKAAVLTLSLPTLKALLSAIAALLS